MEEIVARMLMLARAESETDQKTAPYATDMVKLVIEQFETMADVKKLRLVMSTGGKIVVAVEPEELRLLCSNLILNAIQHSPAGSEVRTRLRKQGFIAELCVEDDGIGIPPEALPNVFDRFYRSDQSRSRGTGGHGAWPCHLQGHRIQTWWHHPCTGQFYGISRRPRIRKASIKSLSLIPRVFLICVTPAVLYAQQGSATPAVSSLRPFTIA
jgi:light-regulated signal transduction histidine kinase (bacteriophytochrome)